MPQEPMKTRRALRVGARALRPIKRQLVASLRTINTLIRAIARGTHRVQHIVEWGVPPVPEWYDHFLDAYWQWPATGSSLGVERGVFGSLAMEPGSRILDLCSGDGYNARYFYAHRAASVTAVDFDADAISYARRTKQARNVVYVVSDIRESLPDGPFEQVVWDAAIEHFTEEEIKGVVAAIKERLVPGGVLSGYTILESPHGGSYLPHHEHEFTNKQDLMRFLVPAFAHAIVFETVYPERTNLYFYAADDVSVLPFAEGNDRFLWGAATDAPR